MVLFFIGCCACVSGVRSQLRAGKRSDEPNEPVKKVAQKTNMNQQPLPPGFISQVDPSTGKTFYVDTRTGKSQWNFPVGPVNNTPQPQYNTLHTNAQQYPASYQPTVGLNHNIMQTNHQQPVGAIPLNHPQTVPTNYHQPVPANYHQPVPASIPSHQQHQAIQPHNTMVPNIPLPPGFITQLDPATGKKYYVDTRTGKSQWNDPRLGSVPSNPSAGYPGSQSISPVVPNNGNYTMANQPRPLPSVPDSVPSNQVPITSRPLPAGFITQLDPKTGKTFFVDTKTGKSQWNDPRESIVEPSPRPLPPVPPRVDISLVQGNIKADAKKPTPSSGIPLPTGFISQIDPKTGKTYYVNTIIGKSQWNDPRDPIDLPSITVSPESDIPTSPANNIDFSSIASAPLEDSKPTLPERKQAEPDNIPSRLQSLNRSKSQSSLSSFTSFVGDGEIPIWQDDYSTEPVFTPVCPCRNVKEAIVHAIIDYMIEIFKMLPQIKDESKKLNSHLQRIVLHLKESPDDETFLRKDIKTRKQIIDVFIAELNNLQVNFEKDRKAYFLNLEYRMMRFLVAKCLSQPIEDIEEDAGYLEDLVHVIASTSLDLHDFMAHARVACLEIYKTYLTSITGEKGKPSYKYGAPFYESLQSGIMAVCDNMGLSYWEDIFPEAYIQSNVESKFYELRGEDIFEWTETVDIPFKIEMKSPYSILLNARHVVQFPVYVQAIYAMTSSSRIDMDQLEAIVLCHPPDSFSAIIQKYGKLDRVETEALKVKTKKDMARIAGISINMNNNSLKRTASLASVDSQMGQMNVSSSRPVALTLPLPSKSSVDGVLSVTSGTLPTRPKSPLSISATPDIPRNPRLNPIENPNKVKNWDGTGNQFEAVN